MFDELKGLMKTENICIERKTCRICGSCELLPIIDLGEQCLASIFIKNETPEFLKNRYPLELVRCSGKNSCGLLQLRHSISPEVLYSDYGYRSGINEQMRDNLKDIAFKAEQMVGLKRNDTVLDIGCNDGTLLESYRTGSLDRLGFDPAENVAGIAENKGIDVVNDFFSCNAFKDAKPGIKAKIITTIAMFYDLEDPCRFTHDVASILADDGVWVMELSYMPFMLEKNSFDTICHEHLEYYTLKQIEWILKKESLQIHRIEFNDINGGSFRLFIRKQTAGAIPDKEYEQISRVRNNERKFEGDAAKPFKEFRDSIEKVRKSLRSLIMDLKRDGKSIYIYGASTKGNTILQYCGIDSRLTEKAADRNPEKWGKRTLGTDIPIVSEEQARAERPEYFLVLPWHFFDVFKHRESDFLDQGGKFIVPLPEMKIIGKEDL